MKQEVIGFRTPKSKRMLQWFLGICYWDRKFIAHLADDTRPVEKLLKREQKFTLGEEQEEAVSRIKKKFRDVRRRDWAPGYSIDLESKEQQTIVNASRAL